VHFFVCLKNKAFPRLEFVLKSGKSSKKAPAAFLCGNVAFFENGEIAFT